MKTLGRILALCVLLLALIPLPADGAGVVTDTLTVKVGYYGMAADKYVEAGTYHWTELSENLALYDEAYTFHRPGDDGKYRVVVDSAPAEQVDDMTLALLLTGAGALLLAAAGAAAQTVYYRKERNP